MLKKLLLFLPFLGMAIIIPSLIFMSNSNTTTNFDNIEKQVIEVADITLSDGVKKNAKLNWSQKKQKVKGLMGKDNPSEFAKWHNGIRTRIGEISSDYTTNYRVKELLKAHGVKSTSDLALNKSNGTLVWQERGPGNVAGRTRAILVDPADANYGTWIVGSVGGGVWKTTDSGETWAELTKDIPTLATSALAWAPNFPNYIYVGTGEGFGNVDQLDGSGIWKTDDAGVTWAQVASIATNPDFENVMRMAVDPADPMVLVVAVSPGFNQGTGTSGVYRTTDGGTTWTKTYEGGNTFLEDMRADPSDFNNQYATINGVGVIKSTDGGQNWVDSSVGIGPVGRMELAIAPSDPNTIYLSAQGGGTGSILYSSNDGGATWFGHANAVGNDVHWLGGQGWYDNTIAVNPYDASDIFVGGVQLWNITASSAVDTSDAQVTGVDLENTQSFWSFVNFGGPYAGGGLDLTSGFFGSAPIDPSEFASVEVRFGPGKTQKAHRFFRGDGSYPYRDYVDVPFEVWDIDNNQQLMVSFRDHEDNGVFELEDRATDPGGIDREYLFLHNIPYVAVEDTNVAQAGGMLFKGTYSMWPEAPGGTGQPDLTAVPDAIVRINWGTFLTKGIETANVTDGYGQFGGLDKGVHVDHHNIVMVKTDESTSSFRLINGNDGGVSYSDDAGTTFRQTGDQDFRGFGGAETPGLKGYNTTQFYGADKMNGADRYIGGAQDNGQWISDDDPDKTSSWVPAPSGDGFEAVWNYRDPDLMLESSQFNSISRSTDRGLTWQNIGGLIPGNGPFFTRLANSKQDPDLVFAISDAGVIRSDNFGASWTVTPMPAGFVGTSSFSQIVISLANPQIVWTARNMTAASHPFVSTNGGVSFDTTNIFTDVTMGRLSGFDTHPTEENTAFALSALKGAPKVMKTTDLGQTWTDISGFGANAISSTGFPDVAVFSLLVMPSDTSIIWAGTEIGIFESTDSGGTWAFADNGLAAVSVYQMLIVNDEVVVATHGRGIWTVAIPELDGYEPPAVTLAPRFASLNGGGGGIIAASMILPSAYDSSFVLIDGVKTVSLGANSAAVDSSFDIAVSVPQLDTVSVALAAYVGGNVLINAPANVVVFPLGEPVGSYAENFDTGSEAFFVFSGLDVGTPAGFDNAAIHSPHPYPDGANMTALLKAPIIVASSNATLKYDDIAIVETGSGSGVFGDPQFWDFAIVEGSKDNGSTWLPLADGYDARADSTWLAVHDAGAAGDSSMYVSHEINLLDTFAADDVILVRFRLFADTNTNGWGWAVDNINIQDGVVSVESGSTVPTVFSMSQNYPNPFNPTTQINYALPKDADVTLQVFNIVGQKVRDIVVGQAQKAGRYTIAWNGRDNSGIQVSSGLYFYRIKAGDFVKTHKMTLLK